MAKVALVSYDVETIFGEAFGVAAFTTRWANLLHRAGEHVTIVMTRADAEPMRVDPEWRARYQQSGISLIELQAPAPLATRWPEVPTMRLSEIVAPVLRGFDIAYFQDWGNTAFHLVRERRYAADPGPVCVTVLHGPSEWVIRTNAKYPRIPQDLHLSYQERYAAKHSDFVVAPTRYMANYLQCLGWEFPMQAEVLGLPMAEPEEQSVQPEPSEISRVVFFGRAEERKGLRIFASAMQHLAKLECSKPRVLLLGAAPDQVLLQNSIRAIADAGFEVAHEGSLNSDDAQKLLKRKSPETLCVIPSPVDNHPYTVVEASLIPGLNLIACRGGGVPEVLSNADGQLCDPFPRDLAEKISERLKKPLPASELARYDCRAANSRWLEFHRKALSARQNRRARPAHQPVPTVDVCVTYYQKPAYFGQLVDALKRQTVQDFHVIAANDGSPDEESNRVFEEQAAKTADRGWDFFRQENLFVDAARNRAVRRGRGDLILFVDADDVPAPNAVARMREAMTLSEDDALICADYLFAGAKRPFDLDTGKLTVPAYGVCIPLGIDLSGGILDPGVFGGSMFIIRRTVFEKIGGFRELRGAGHEDWEFYVRLALAGYRIDVLPELLHYYRQVEDGLARTLPTDVCRRRLLDAYEDSLRTVGLEGAGLALAGLYRKNQELEGWIQHLDRKLKLTEPPGRYAFFSRRTNGFETDPPVVGWLRQRYREFLPLDTRLKVHRIFLAPFIGEYKPPPQ